MKMKKLLATLLSIVCVLPLISGIAFAMEQDAQEDQIKAAAKDFLSASAENMWLYADNDLSAGTITELAAEPDSLSDASICIGLQSEEISMYLDDISFAQEKAEYFKEMRLEQNIQRYDFQMLHILGQPEITNNYASVSAIEYIAFHYSNFPDVLSEITNYYTVELIKYGEEWFVVGVTAENDDFDATYKGTGFTVETAAEIFAEQEAKMATATDEISETLMDQYGFVDESLYDSEIRPLATEKVYYNYNADNATAYAYTYVTSTFGKRSWSDVTAAERAYGRTFYNANFKSFGESNVDCQNFASQCIWAGFNGSNSIDQIYNTTTKTFSPIMDTGGSYVWKGSIPNYSVNSPSWSSCSNFRTYITGEEASGDPDMIVKSGKLGSTEDFSSIYTELKGALLHVSDGGHAIIVTDVAGPKRADVLFCGHTADRKGISIADMYGTGTISYFIPQKMRIRNAPEVRITAALQRPVPVGTSVSVLPKTDVSCASCVVSVKDPAGGSVAIIRDKVTLSAKGLYTITVTAKKTATSTPVVYVYTIRTYEL